MIELYISQRPVVIPEDINFTFLFENPYFTSNGNSSYNIELPLEGCSENIRIFGHLHRLWTPKSRLTYTAELRDNGRVMLNGTAIVNEVTNTSVKVQLVSGNSEFNFRTSQDGYINKLDLGTINFPYIEHLGQLVDASRKHEFYGSVDELPGVWCPVKYTDQYYNRMILELGTPNFHPRAFYNNICVQPYLTYVLKKLVAYFGYEIGINDIENSFLRNLYIVNAVQSTKVAAALPKWTLSEFLDELEKFCAVVTVVDENTKTVNFVGLSDFYENYDTVVIPADDVIEEYQVQISNQTDDKDITTGNLSFSLPSLDDNRYHKIDENIVALAKTHEAQSYEQIGVFFGSITEEERFKYIVTCGSRQYIYYDTGTEKIIKEVNLFRDLIRNTESDIDVTFKIVPAAIEQYNTPIYLAWGDCYNGDAKPSTYIKLNVPVTNFFTQAPSDEINIQQAVDGDIEFEKKDDTGKDIMEVALNVGLQTVGYTYSGQTLYYEYPCPFTDFQQVVPNMQTTFPSYSLSLYNVGVSDCLGYRFQSSKRLASYVAYKISFRTKAIQMDAKKVYIIANQTYHCEKIEVSVDKDGFSNIAEGTFYRVE